MFRFCAIITVAIMAIALCLAVVGTAGSQFHGTFTDGNGVDAKAHVFLYKTRTEVNGDNADDYYDRDDFACGSLYDKLTTAFVFGIIGCVASALAVIFLIARIVAGLTRFVPVVFCLAACASLVIAFANSVSTYARSQCGVDSYFERDFRIDWGLALLIAGAGVSLFGSCMSLVF
eukprot:GDKK01064386.1.p1 GENE.GDKK01064386.1~~GDKK01064386.1.p1  ORF type:complete len:175 (+),score=9.57 GDKK01064386.1:37-561(+)